MSAKTNEESIYVDDSDDEESSFRDRRSKFLNSTRLDSHVIGDSDLEKSERQDVTLLNKYDSDGKSVDSEEEDIEFLNASHRVLLAVSSESEDESSPDIRPPKRNNLKRRSIYDNPESPFTIGNKSSSINGKLKKRTKRIIAIDSDSEDSLVNQLNLSAKNRRSMIKKNVEKNDNDVQKFDVQSLMTSDEDMEEFDNYVHKQSKTNLENSNHIANETYLDDDDDHEMKKIQEISKKNHSDLDSTYFDEDLKPDNKENTPNALNTRNSNVIDRKPLNLQNLNRRSSVHNKKLEQCSFSDLLDESSDSSKNNKTLSKTANVISTPESKNKLFLDKKNVDLTINGDQFPETKKEQEEILISSTSTSENELDEDAVAFAKKEIGVGNIDPIQAQKKEMLILKINRCQNNIDKLQKFTTTVDIERLPDKGQKVYNSIKDLQKEMLTLKTQLEALNRKTASKIKVSSTPKVKTEPETSDIISPFWKTGNNVKQEPRDVKQENSEIIETDYSGTFEDIDIKNIPKVPKTNFDTRDLGKQALETLNKQQFLTNQRLEHLHGSLTSRPTEDQRDKDPKGLKIPLMPHQQHALAWMRWRESQKPRGGILADDMGLGKTLTMISLVLANVDQDQQRSDSNDSSSGDEWYSKNKHKRYYGGTLVVCPASLINQWEGEVKKRIQRGLLTVLVFHGNNRQVNDRKLSKFNIVITTYQTLVREAEKETGFYRMEWSRIILDEAHVIRNHKSKASIAACGTTAKRRWTLTGTPIQNKEADLYAILKFLKCSPFDDLQVWKRWVENKNDAGKQRLITLMKTLMLRRTKKELMAKGALESLPEKFFETIEIDMDSDENLVYQKILLFSQNLFAQFLNQRAEKHHMRELNGGKFEKPSYQANQYSTQFTKAQKLLLQHHAEVESHEILVLLLRLRQMCCHPALIHKMLEKMDAELNGIDDANAMNEGILEQLQNMSIKEDEDVDEAAANYKFDAKIATNLLTKNNPVFSDDRRSSKVRAVLKTIEKILDKGDKVIVVSQWTEFLKVIARNTVDLEDARYEMFTGEVAIKDRQKIVDKFNDPRSDVDILFLSLTAGGVGLNLVGANHLILVDLHWNPQLESQAQDRIYRFGQKKNVFIYKFLCKDSIEERILVLQQRKLACADYVLTGTKSMSTKLTLDDLKLLFS